MELSLAVLREEQEGLTGRLMDAEAMVKSIHMCTIHGTHTTNQSDENYRNSH